MCMEFIMGNQIFKEWLKTRSGTPPRKQCKTASQEPPSNTASGIRERVDEGVARDGSGMPTEERGAAGCTGGDRKQTCGSRLTGRVRLGARKVF